MIRYNYILVTPAKNEENNLPGLIQSITCQKLRPLVWFIIDDYSQDKTPLILQEASSRYQWIQFKRLNIKSNYDLGEHYAYVCREGFKLAVEYCIKNILDYEYIALSDADMLYPNDYFLNVVEFLNRNTEYGIVSGKILIRDLKGDVYEEKEIQISKSFPRGSGRVWRKRAFEETYGYILAKSPDSVSNALALLKGWQIGQVDVICYQTRDTGNAGGLWRGYFNQGERRYYLGANPLNIFNNVVGLVFISRQRKALLKSLALVCGYLHSFIKRKKRIDIKEVRDFYGSYKGTFSKYKIFIKRLLGLTI